jgi:hypothetical protein
VLNKEKYAKEIVEIACNGCTVGMRNGILCPCNSISECGFCDFYDGKTTCEKVIKEWANSEYKEREIDWSKVPIDTPVYVWDINERNNIKRYFAGYDKENNAIITFDGGKTSWSSTTTTKWIHAKIKEGVDCSEWYKD